jgi:hypothetical protein
VLIELKEGKDYITECIQIWQKRFVINQKEESVNKERGQLS